MCMKCASSTREIQVLDRDSVSADTQYSTPQIGSDRTSLLSNIYLSKVISNVILLP